MKTNVNVIIIILIVFLFLSCSENSDSKKNSKLISIIKTDDLDKLKFNHGNIYIIPEKHGKEVNYFIQTKQNAMMFSVKNDGILSALSIIDDKNEDITTVYKLEKDTLIWEIESAKELITIKINKHDKSNFEIIKTKIE